MNFTGFDHECMAAALRLASRGMYTTDPNPRVGCVIADGQGIIASGWHEYAGGPHAEIAALERAGSESRGKTAYVSLEPCAHQGRTPPCADALVEAGIARVVVACEDPNPLVGGTGLERMRAAGLRVESGLMADAASELNRGFFLRMREGRPWVRVKSALSLDGRTALKNGDSKWISGEASRRDVQHWRARSSAIMTGIGTVLADDPRMTVRLDTAVKQPLRIVVDSQWRTPPGSRILEGTGPVLIAGDASVPIPPGLRSSDVECLGLPVTGRGVDLGALMKELARREINEIQVEAGALLAGALLETELVDELLIYQAFVVLGDGGPGLFALGPLESMQERTHFKLLETVRFGDDLRLRLKPNGR